MKRSKRLKGLTSLEGSKSLGILTGKPAGNPAGNPAGDPAGTASQTRLLRRPISPSTRQRRTPRAARSCRTPRTPRTPAPSLSRLAPRIFALARSSQQPAQARPHTRPSKRIALAHAAARSGLPGQRTAHEPAPKHPSSVAGAELARFGSPHRTGEPRAATRTGSNTHKSTRQQHQKRSHQGRTSKLAPTGAAPRLTLAPSAARKPARACARACACVLYRAKYAKSEHPHQDL